MIETLDYQEVPFHFVHCLRADCPKASTCLRYQVARFLPVDKRTVTILNPALVSNPVECKEYLSDTPVHQCAIKKIFLKYGIEDDPVFDRYEPVYPW